MSAITKYFMLAAIACLFGNSFGQTFFTCTQCDEAKEGAGFDVCMAGSADATDCSDAANDACKATSTLDADYAVTNFKRECITTCTTPDTDTCTDADGTTGVRECTECCTSTGCTPPDPSADAPTTTVEPTTTVDDTTSHGTNLQFTICVIIGSAVLSIFV
jgi:hypothetical protein